MGPTDHAAEPLRLAYLFAGPVRHEEVSHERGSVPSHRLFFAVELRRLGDVVTSCPWRLPSWLPGQGQLWRLAQASWCALHQRGVDAVVCTHEAAAFWPLFLKRAGLLRRPVVVLTVAATGEPYRRRDLPGHLRRSLLSHADQLCAYTSAQVDELVELLSIDPRRVTFLPFGIDPEFFAPDASVRRGDLVLSVGTNPGKDYPTLVRALPAEDRLVIVSDADNIAEARAAMQVSQQITFRSHVPIEELRDLYRECRVMVLPLRDIGISTGQTVLLENLALGTPVIVSDVPAVSDYVGEQDDQPVLVPPGDVAALAEALVRAAVTHRGDGSPPQPHPASASAQRMHTLIHRLLASGTSVGDDDPSTGRHS